jgi:hypothetical protein
VCVGRCCHSYLLLLACLFTVRVGIAPLLLSGCQDVLPSLLNVFFSQLLVYHSDFFPLFFPGWGSVCLWAMLIYHVPLSSSGCQYLPKQSGSSCLVAWEPSWFLHYCGVWMLCVGWGCGGAVVLPLLSGFSCQAYLQLLSKILL